MCAAQDMGLVSCPNDTTTACHCVNCNGSGVAYVMTAVWAIAQSPLLAGGRLPLDPQTEALLTNKDMLYVHANARNQKVIEFYQANLSCTPKTKPTCDWMAHGWTKISADLVTSAGASTSREGRGADEEEGWRSIRKVGTATTEANPPVKAVLIVNVGHPQNTCVQSL